MSSSVRPVRILPRLSFSAAAFSAGLALGSGCLHAQQADRCSGTLCDLYYGAPAPEYDPNAKKAAPTPLTVPTTGNGVLGFVTGGAAQPATSAQGANGSAPAKPPLVAVQGGGIIGMLSGSGQQRCGGTLCDLYYGGPSPEEKAEQDGTAAPAPQGYGTSPSRGAGESGGAGPVPAAASADADQAAPAEDLTVPVGEGHEAPPVCAATGRDPWKCYR